MLGFVPRPNLRTKHLQIRFVVASGPSNDNKACPACLAEPYQPRDPTLGYDADFEPEKEALCMNNPFYIDLQSIKS